MMSLSFLRDAHIYMYVCMYICMYAHIFGNLSPGGLRRNSVASIFDCPKFILAAECGRTESN